MVVSLIDLSFSILERIDDVVTEIRRLVWRIWPTFSILERIDDVVTRQFRLDDAPDTVFQYPRTDRRCCDRASCKPIAQCPTTFSILERIDDVVTATWRTQLMRCMRLSVSSNGSTML